MAATLLQVRLARAVTMGREAAEQGKPVTACPYSALGGERQRLLAHAWVRGHRRASSPTAR